MPKSLIFSNQHVEAILAGRKTMTRRLVKGERQIYYLDREIKFDPKLQNVGAATANAYARPGDRIVVKEPFWEANDGKALFIKPPYAGPAKSPMFMPWKESRCTIEVVSCRVERLFDMPFADTFKEGYLSFERERFFEEVWDKLNPRAKAATNPWVYVLEFFMLKGRWE
jgi:hypothetical protein